MPSADPSREPVPAPVPALIEPSGLPAVPAEAFRREVETAAGFALSALAPATRRAYRSDFARFTTWCQRRGLVELPADPETVAVFLASEASAGLKPATIARRSAAIRYAHGLDRKEPPTNTEAVRATVRGIRRRTGTAPSQKTPATAQLVASMAALAPADTLRGLRDRALLLLGFAGAFRRSELVSLYVDDLVLVQDGLRVVVRKSKTDQEGAGQEIAIPRGARLRPVEAVRAWLDAAGIVTGPVFRRVRKNGLVGADALTAEAVALVVKRYADAAGLRSEDFAGHSLRAGFLTSGAENGASVFKLMEVSRHKSMDTLSGYVRRAELFKDHAGAEFL